MQKATAVISLNAIEKNARFVRSLIGDKKFYAVVKANAYGHGAEEVALRLENIVDGFCVAINSEGAALRVAGVSKPVLVFTPPLSEEDAEEADYYNLTVTVNGERAARLAKNLPCHIKVNTGMNRVGCDISELTKVLSLLDKNLVNGIYSHMYAPADRKSVREQLGIFKQAVALAKAINPEATAHISSSAGVLSGSEYLFDGARVGILLYGYPPAGFTATVTPAMQVYAPLVQSTDPCGHGAGYMRTTAVYSRLYTYRYGYADGLPRVSKLGESPLCMDGFVSDSGGDMRCVLADAQKIAADCGTISYEILCRAAGRCEKIYER